MSGSRRAEALAGGRGGRSRDEGRRPATSRERRRALALAWGGALVAPLVWAVALLGSYALVPVACDTGWMWLLHGLRAVTGLAALALTAGAYSVWRARATPAADDPRPHAVSPFLGLVGTLVGAFSVVLIAYEGIANFFVDPCL